ncbi:MAG TPA: type 4a pilus biogenesis protein PilO [Pyrinomonadaceae bacterium]|jgi:type IV pilus assembly protein PilO|nr:type 4a pilus biogenesis protein PilO [Pyrinomonadaceae bacterium]
MLKLDALQQKPWFIQLAAFGFIALLVYGGFWNFVTSGTRAETKELQAKVDTLQQQNARAQIASQRLNDFKATYARAQADYEDLKALLPEQRELTTVLQGLQDRARGRLSVTRFTPKEDVQQDFYAGKPVEIEVSSSYNNLGAFFAQIAAYQRIVSISDFKLSRMKDQGLGKTVDAQFLLTAYYASSEKLQNTAKSANPTQVPAAATTAPAPAAK